MKEIERVLLGLRSLEWEPMDSSIYIPPVRHSVQQQSFRLSVVGDVACLCDAVRPPNCGDLVHLEVEPRRPFLLKRHTVIAVDFSGSVARHHHFLLNLKLLVLLLSHMD